MKKVLIIAVLVICSYLLLAYIPKPDGNNDRDFPISSSPKTLGMVDELEKGGKLEIKDKVYNYEIYDISDPSNLGLIVNYQNKLGAKNIKTDGGCKFLVNGGYYLEDGKPLGLVITEGKVYASFQKNSLLNGVVSLNDFGIPRITRVVPEDHLEIALQSGPILIENAQVLDLKLKSDKEARRIVALISGENRLYFLVVYNGAQVFDGPLLSDLPEVVSKIAGKENIILADALNLDGGAASAYYSEQTSLSELSHIGSAFCYK